jgi:hypothetical protein
MIYFLNIDWSAHEIPRLMLTTGPTKDQHIFVLIAAVLRVSIKGMIQVNLNLTYNRSDDHLRADINPHYIEG